MSADEFSRFMLLCFQQKENLAMKTHSLISKIVCLVVIFFFFLAFAILPAQTSAAPLTQEGSSLTNQIWVRLGGPIGGLGYDIRMRPDNPDIMDVTDANAGVHYSNDGGMTWSPQNAGINARSGPTGDIIPVFSLTIDPNNYDILWIGFVEPGGIYRSIDGGLSWEKRTVGIEELQGLTFRGIAVEPGNSDVIYAAAEINSWRWAGESRNGHNFDMTKGVVYKSIDSGGHWTAIWRGDNLARYVWIDPRDHNVLYVSTGIFDREAANTNVDANEPGGVGIIKSTDGGQTWNILDAEEGLTGLYVGSLFMHPENPDMLLAGSGHDYWSAAYDQGGEEISPGGVFLTEDGGATWKQTLSHIQIYSVEYCLGYPNVAYAAGPFAVYRSEDSGHTWQLMSGGGVTYGKYWGPPGIVAGFPIDIQCDPRNADRLFVNNYGGGNFLSEDGGRTWVDASRGYSGAMVFGGLALDQNNPARIYAGARSGLFRSDDGGRSWSGLAFSPANHAEITSVAINPSDSDVVISSPWDANKLFKSSTGGLNWTPIVNEFGTGRESGQRAVDLAYSPSDPRIIYAAVGFVRCKYMSETCDEDGKGVYESNNGGKTWVSANNDETKQINAMSLAIDPTNPNIVYVAAVKDGVYKTVNGGDDWTKLPVYCKARSVAMDPVNTNKVFVGCEGGVRYSLDGGVTWVSSSAGMPPEALVTAIVVDPSNSMYIWSADYFSGVYFSADGGKTWRQNNDGLTCRAVLDLVISADGQTLYTATHGGGVFRLSIHDQAYFDFLVPTPTAVSPTITPTSLVAETPSDVSTPIPSSMPETSTNPTCAGAAIVPLGLALFAQWKRKSRK